MEMFDLMEINCAMVEKDMITITDLEIKRDQDECKKSGPEQNSIGAGPLHLCSWTTEGADRRCGVLSPCWRNPKYVSFYNQECVTECVIKFAESPNLSRSLPPNSSPNLVIY